MPPFVRDGATARVGLVAVLLLVGALVGCGSEDEGGEPAVLGYPSAQAPPPIPGRPPKHSMLARWSNERFGRGPLYANANGVLVKRDGTEIRGWGDPRVRRYVTGLFARMQYDFLTGNMASLCKHVDVPPGASVSPGGRPRNGSCEDKLEAYAKELEEQDFKSSPLRFLWVRTYPRVAGVWVEHVSGKRFRVPFVQGDDGRWRLEIGDLSPRDALGMRLQVGAG